MSTAMVLLVVPLIVAALVTAFAPPGNHRGAGSRPARRAGDRRPRHARS